MSQMVPECENRLNLFKRRIKNTIKKFISEKPVPGCGFERNSIRFFANLLFKNIVRIFGGSSADPTLTPIPVLRRHILHINGSENRLAVAFGNRLIDFSILIRGRRSINTFCAGVDGSFSTFEIIEDQQTIKFGGSYTFIGKTVSPNLILRGDAQTSVVIGDDFVFSHGIEVRTSDSLEILEKNGTHLNLPRSVTIGDHVWVRTRAMILKGPEIRSGVTLFSCSVSSGMLASDGVYAGVPARNVHSGVYWRR